MGDQIDQAIAGSEPAPAIASVQIPVTLAPDGRPALVIVPEDISDDELIRFASWILVGLRPHIATQRPRSSIVVASRLPT